MYKIENRRYIGSKSKLINEIKNTLDIYDQNYTSFLDLFGGTGLVTNNLKNKYEYLFINDILYSNNCVYNAFFGKQEIDKKLILKFIEDQNKNENLINTFFSKIYANTYFDELTAKRIGTIRNNIEDSNFNNREKNILISSLIYSADRCANTVGHYESFFKTQKNNNTFEYKPIELNENKDNNIKIYRQDANKLIKTIKSDVVYIDPPYNSRQYSRFYHVLETLVKWEEFKPQGAALKPPLENLSGYSRKEAKDLFDDLITNLEAKLIIVSYSNTYTSSSDRSNNKIKYDEIINILQNKGNLTIKEIKHPHFNAGKTKLNNNIEYLFICEVYND